MELSGISMSQNFADEEGLFRAVWPYSINPSYWESENKISSAALKDKNGLSVDRDGGRNLDEVITTMRKNFIGVIAKFLVKDCIDVSAVVMYLPSKENKYHCEIHGNGDKKELSSSQARRLSRKLQIVSK